jgi:hypothetical protein
MSIEASNAQSVATVQDGPSRLGKFIQTYHSFLSSFVIGAAGLIATSIWQYRQSDIAMHQAEAQQRIAVTQADNNWRIERAEILSKNLQTLSASGENNVEQRYGVLLSLTRGNILDSELAISYALELGRDNPEYMKSVLASTADKSYPRLSSAFEMTCEQRFDVDIDVPLCKHDKQADRSAAIAELIGDETIAAHRANKRGPLILLDDEREVQGSLVHFAWLFTPYLSNLYERRQWSEIKWFEGQAPAARLIAAMVLGPAKRGEFIPATEAAEIAKFHDAHVRNLVSYLFGPTCNGECKGKLVDFMLTFCSEAEGRFDEPLRQLLARPRGEVAPVLARMQSRMLLCQVEDQDEYRLRDQVLVPVLKQEMQKARPDFERIEDILSLLAFAADPNPSGENNSMQLAYGAWKQVLDKARGSSNERVRRAFDTRRAAVQTTRAKPSLALKRAMFCSAAPVEQLDIGTDLDE